MKREAPQRGAQPPEKAYYDAQSSSLRHYDLLTEADRDVQQDIGVYATLARSGGSILELGAGTGRVAIALAERGFDVTGIDIAAGMLEQAEAKRATLPPEVAARLRFVRGDMLSLTLGEPFDAVIATYFTLAHLQPSTTWRKAFTVMRRHLAPDGAIAVHLPIAAKMDRPAPDPTIPVFRSPIDADNVLTLYVVHQAWNPAMARFELVIEFVTSRTDGSSETRSRERLVYYDADAIDYARRAGLEPVGAPIALGESGMIFTFADRAGNRPIS